MKNPFLYFLIICVIILIGCGSVSLISKGEVFKSLTQITFSESDDTYPTFDSNSKKMLFQSNRDGDFNIYLKDNISSKVVIKKTNHKGIDIHPCFSPDGEKFCFSSNRTGNFDIFVMNTSKGFAKTQITMSDNDEIMPNWSPTNSLIAFCQYSKVDRQWYIWTKNIDNGQLTQICRGLEPVFTKDGQHIFYKRTNKRYYELWKIDINGENESQYISNENWGIASFRLNPDGNKIIFSTSKDKSFYISRNYDGMDLWMLDLNSGTQTQLTTHKGSDFDPFWASNGKIYFASDRLGDTNIWSFKSEF